jgi:prepilin-type N-terminal cleavage/methylation domain-containing protein
MTETTPSLTKPIRFHKQAGFTLIELMISIAAMGIVLAIFSSAYNQVGALRNVAEDDRLRFENMQIGLSLMEVAEKTNGRLPAQEAGNQIPLLSSGGADAERFKEALWSRGLSEMQISSDGGVQQNERLYRQIEEVVEAPLFGNSGARVDLEIDYATIYVYSDDIEDLYPSGFDANFDIEDLSRDDLGNIKAFVFSSRSYQEQMLNQTASRVQRLRQALNNFVTMRRLQAPPNELLTANFWPGTFAGGGAGTPVCGHNWVRLASSSVLSDIGLDSVEFEETAWGDPIFYCRNYGANTSAPYYAALAIAKDVNSGATTLPNGANAIIISL